MNWAVEAGRSAATETTHSTLVLSRIGFLVAVLVACGIFAIRAFRIYERLVRSPCARRERMSGPIGMGARDRGADRCGAVTGAYRFAA